MATKTEEKKPPLLAVEVKDLHLTYGKGKSAYHVLKGVNMIVEEGNIYGLLGSSGCGKTTLLKCLLGQIWFKKGSVLVFGEKPGTKRCSIPGSGVGYMPQDISLYNNFTIGETFHFFGCIFGMAKEMRDERADFMQKFLDLPTADRFVKDLSGGQKRRVSLGAALIHTPPLLILDEPTVGVDPVLRENIWAHLLGLAKEFSMTIIITTHYIDETKQADYIGFMRQGVMLVETTPKGILEKFNVVSLEKAFLRLCLMQQADEKVEKRLTDGYGYSKGGGLQRAKVKISHILGALLRKNYLNLIRNWRIIVVQTLLPTFVLILFCICIGAAPKGLDIAIVNKDEPKGPSLSEAIIKKLDKNFLNPVPVSSEDEAKSGLKDGEFNGAFVFQQNFTLNTLDRLSPDFCERVKGLEEEQIQPHISQTKITFLADITEEPIYETVLSELNKAIEKALNELPRNKRFMFNVSQTFITEIEAIHGQRDPLFRDFLAPGLIVCCIYFLAVGLTVLTLVVEKHQGLFHRILVAGVKPYQILIAHIIIQFVSICVQVALMLLVLFLVFGLKSKGGVSGYFWTTLLIIAQGIVGMAFGFVLSAMYDEEKKALTTGLSSFYPKMILSGVVWPLDGQPAVVRYICYFLPQTQTITALRNIWTKGYDITDLNITLAFLSCLGWIIIFIALSMFIFTLRK